MPGTKYRLDLTAEEFALLEEAVDNHAGRVSDNGYTGYEDMGDKARDAGMARLKGVCRSVRDKLDKAWREGMCGRRER